MESITFADILFTVIVLAVTFGILYLVNKAKNKKTDSQNQDPGAADKSSEETSS